MVVAPYVLQIEEVCSVQRGKKSDADVRGDKRRYSKGLAKFVSQFVVINFPKKHEKKVNLFP